jgi:TonB family protein
MKRVGDRLCLLAAVCAVACGTPPAAPQPSAPPLEPSASARHSPAKAPAAAAAAPEARDTPDAGDPKTPWSASPTERWIDALDRYSPSAKPGNQTALNTSAAPFTAYLRGMHERIHPLYAEAFLPTLHTLPKNHPMNDTKLFTRVEIVLDRTGRVRTMGVVRKSGVTAFDIGALDAIDRASPFAPPPPTILSTDGNVYVNWAFFRDDEKACSLYESRPFLLNVTR